mgnify:CR=1 FL=1
MKIDLGLIKQTMPELTWEAENDSRAVAKSGALKFYAAVFGNQFEVSIFDLILGRTIFTVMNPDLKNILNILRLHCQKLIESLLPLRA